MEWVYVNAKKHKFQNRAVNLACLLERSSVQEQVSSEGTATHGLVKKKILSVHGSTNRSQLWSNNKTPTECTTKNSPLLSSSNHILQIDAIQHPLLPVYRKNRKPLAKEINYCNSILCFRAHKGPHEYCQIILHGTVLYFSPIYTADIEEVPCLLHLSWDDTINFYLWGTWPT